MYDMMNTTGMYAASAAFGSIHALAMLAGLAGFVLLLAWAIKSMPAAQLKQWGIWLLVGGILVSLLTFGAVYAARGTGMMQGARMMHGVMDDDDRGGMMDDDDREEMMDEMMGHDMDDDDDHMNMSMNGMSEALEGKTGDAFDEAFIRMMIPHHQGAIDMAVAAKRSAGHQEIKDMADEIIEAQQREIDMMNGWLQSWGYND